MSTTATVVVSILGFIAFFYVNLYAGSYRMRRSATAFLNALVQGRHADAQALLTSKFQGAVPKQGFERFLAERGITSITRFTRSHGDFSIGVDRGSVNRHWSVKTACISRSNSSCAGSRCHGGSTSLMCR